MARRGVRSQVAAQEDLENFVGQAGVPAHKDHDEVVREWVSQLLDSDVFACVNRMYYLHRGIHWLCVLHI